MTYTAVPQANQQISATQAPILNNFSFLGSAIGIDHGFNTSDATKTWHKQATWISRSDPGSVPSGTVGMSYSDSGGQLKHFDGTNIYQLTKSLVGSTNGYQWIGSVLLQWGFNNSLLPEAQVNFSSPNIPFPNNCFNVIAIPTTPGTPPPSAIVPVIGVGQLLLKTAFGYVCNLTGTSNWTGFFWIAIGN